MTLQTSTTTASRYRAAIGRISLLLAGMLMLTPGYASVFEQLGSVQRAAIVETCLPVRYDAGVDAWRECIEREAIAVAEPATSRTQRNLGLDERFALQKLCTNEADRACYTRALAALDLVPEPQLDDLRDDEQHALARACFVIQNTGGPAAWRQCMTEQAARLRSSPDVNLDALVLTERNAALNSCNNSPVTDYRNCLNRAGAPAANRPAIATRGAPSNAPATGVLASLQTAAADYAAPVRADRPVDDAPPVASPAGNVAIVSPQRAAVEAEKEPTQEPGQEPGQSSDQQSSTPGLGAADPVVSTEEATVNPNAVAEPDSQDTSDVAQGSAPLVSTDQQPDESSAPLPSMFKRLSESVNGLDTTGRTALLAAAALPLLALLGILAARRKTAEPYYQRDTLSDQIRSYADEPQFDNVPPRQQSRPPDTQAIRSRFNSEADDLFETLDATITDESGLHQSVEREARSVQHDRAEDFTFDDTGLHAEFGLDDTGLDELELNETLREPLSPTPTDVPDETPTRLVTPNEPQHDLGAPVRPTMDASLTYADWLHSEPQQLRQQHAIELLIYWIAYADERYEQASKQAVLQADQPDAHERIKACVFRKDHEALAASLQWLMQHSTPEQRVQIIELLVALLVTDAEPTPVQNTLLRFFTDVLGFGADHLDQIWVRAFGVALPKLPRVDRVDWWDARNHQALGQRDARTVAGLEPQGQYLVRLGLPLSGESSDVVIENAWRLAAERCNPARFAALGERERQMAERQMSRFDEAREGLLSHAPDNSL